MYNSCTKLTSGIIQHFQSMTLDQEGYGKIRIKDHMYTHTHTHTHTYTHVHTHTYVHTHTHTRTHTHSHTHTHIHTHTNKTTVFCWNMKKLRSLQIYTTCSA